jgi:hypothetical protein
MTIHDVLSLPLTWQNSLLMTLVFKSTGSFVEKSKGKEFINERTNDEEKLVSL